MASAPIYASTPRQSQARVAAANTGRDGSGTIVTLFTPGASGSRLDRIRGCSEVALTAGQARLWFSSNAGSTWRMFHEELIVATGALSATVGAWQFDKTFAGGMQVPAGCLVGVTMNNNEAANFFAEGGDY